MFTRASERMKKVLSYPSNLLAACAMAAMVFAVLSVTVSVIARQFGVYFFVSPVWDLNYLAFAVIVWGPMAMAAFKGSHITLTFLLDKFPRLPRLGLQLIISLVSSGLMALVSWRLLVNAITLEEQSISTTFLRLPYAPLGYFAAFACAIMALAFLTRFPEALGKFRKEQ